MAQSNALCPPISDILAGLASSDYGALYRCAMSFTRNPAQACDLVQDTFERALRLPTGEISCDGVRRWLFVTLRNLFIDRYRADTRQRLLPLRHELHVESPETDERPRWRLVDDDALEACVKTIDPRLRRVYELHVADGLPLTAIATHLGIPASTAGTRLHRARRQLRARLEREISLQISATGGAMATTERSKVGRPRRPARPKRVASASV